MSDVVVGNHILDFMKSSSVGAARNVLNVYDKPIIDNLNTSYTSNSGAWVNTTNTVNSNIDNWNLSYSYTRSLSAYVESKISRVSLSSVNTNFSFIDLQSGVLTSYSNTQNITAYIGPEINTPNFVTTVAQLSSGTITLKLSSSYTDGSLISYGDLYETAGVGATANIVRVSDNKFLITGLLQ
jgi:hypothetical protein